MARLRNPIELDPFCLREPGALYCSSAFLSPLYILTESAQLAFRIDAFTYRHCFSDGRDSVLSIERN